MATTVADQGATFSITDTKRYVPLVTLSTQDNAKLLEQLKPCFRDDYTTGCLLDYPYFKNYFKMIATDLKAHRKISKKRCFEEHCSCDQACQFSALFRKLEN